MVVVVVVGEVVVERPVQVAAILICFVLADDRRNTGNISVTESGRT
jgi:hypothetical protein